MEVGGRRRKKKKRKNILARIKKRAQEEKKANEGTLRVHIKGLTWWVAKVQRQRLRPFYILYFHLPTLWNTLDLVFKLHGQTLQFQRCWSVNVIRPKKHTLIISNPEKCLEEWTNIRNTKTQYSKQLRNFLKVRIPSYWTDLNNTY